MSFSFPSPAKLNLFLYVTGQRTDGYHELQTLFQFLDYSDTLSITPTTDQTITLLTELPGVNHDDNLIVKAANLLQQLTKTHSGATLTIDKRLPIGGGLGGGSSNAATVLLALNHLWRTGLTLQELSTLGVQLGADVPIFIHGHAAFAEGIGEQLQDADPEEKWYLVAHPGIMISTPSIFADPELKRDSPKRTLTELLQQPFRNDCEPIARKQFYEVEQLLLWLLEYAPARLTGTGACVFAEFDTEATARQVLNQAPEWLRGFVARGTNRSPLHQTLLGMTTAV